LDKWSVYLGDIERLKPVKAYLTGCIWKSTVYPFGRNALMALMDFEVVRSSAIR
jgi:hypothetical protein